MKLDDALKSVSVAGAGGKMGSGISLLLLQEMARCEAEHTGKVGNGWYSLTLIDVNDQARIPLRRYLRTQILKYAEKNINLLRSYFANDPSLVSNEDIVRTFVEGSLDIVHFDTDLAKAKKSTLVFEAIVEDVEAKTTALTAMKAEDDLVQYFLTNTSSIPISLLDSTCHLHHRIIGFHFYNPPAVQKILEIEMPAKIDPELVSLAHELGRRLGKTMVCSHDVPGFIGNGYLMRELMFACRQVRELVSKHRMPQSKAVYIIDRITQEYLLRPMGIFQLADYVGIDVCQKIGNIMRTHLPETSLHDELIDEMIGAGVLGGQYPDGNQKNGFFQYDHHKITGAYSLENKKYETISEEEVQRFLGPHTDQKLSWKAIQSDPEKNEKIHHYFNQLSKINGTGANLAKEFLNHLKEVAQRLVKDGVADQLKDVETVLQHGFFHPYSPFEVL